MIVQAKPGVRPGMTLRTHPNYFTCTSERKRWLTRGAVHTYCDPDTGLTQVVIDPQPPYRRL